MRSLSIYIAILACFIAVNTHAQQLTGQVVSERGEPLPEATVYWENTTEASFTDLEGWFSIQRPDTMTNLFIQYVGYTPGKVPIYPEEDSVVITMQGITELEEVKVSEQQQDNYVSTLQTVNQEVIGAGELRKAPCCNLSESFETNASVDITYSDAITGTKEIRMLGLRGIYSQLLLENRPVYGGLSTPYELEYLPGTWISSIQISKGVSSVRNGYQAITGQINSELIKPFEEQTPIFINLFGASTGRLETNVHLNKKLSEKWSTGLLLHGSTLQNEIDNNDDAFLDTPEKEQLNGLYRLFYRGDKWRGQINFQAIRDRRTAGQLSSLSDNGQTPYRIDVAADRFELFGKVGFLGFEKPYNTMGLIFNGVFHQQDAVFGPRTHEGRQRRIYTNLLYSTILGTTDHKLDLGASFLWDEYREALDAMPLNRTEQVPGVFVEYSFGRQPLSYSQASFMDRLGLIAGLRVDRHNLFDWLVTPRMSAKYSFSENAIFRLSAGKGYRTANVIAENYRFLASNRQFVIAGDLDVEEAWNYGANLTISYPLLGRRASVALDFFRTQFQNQIVVDPDADFSKVFFYNLDGRSFSNSLLIFNTLPLLRNLDLRLGYKLNEVKTTFDEGGFVTPPLVVRHRGLVAVDYELLNSGWMLNANVQLVGTQRLPDNEEVPSELLVNHPPTAPAYAIVGGQASKGWGQIEVYAGVENATAYIQDLPIIDYENPQSPYFDGSQVFAPTLGRRFYAGIRYSIQEGKIKHARIRTSAQCGMCEDAIEGALAEVPGIEDAQLDLVSKDLEVHYSKDQISLNQIRQIIAGIGYDADMILADPQAYEELPACCKKDVGH